MMDILTFVNELQKRYEQQSDDFKALVQDPKRVQAVNFERYTVNLWRYLDGKTDRTDEENTLYKFVCAFIVDYNGFYM